MPNDNMIPIFAAAPLATGPDGRPLQARGLAEQFQKASNVAVEQLEESFSSFIANMSRVLSKAQSVVGSYDIDRVEIEAAVSADGKVGLAGSGVGLSGTASLKLILVRAAKAGKAEA